LGAFDRGDVVQRLVGQEAPPGHLTRGEPLTGHAEEPRRDRRRGDGTEPTSQNRSESGRAQADAVPSVGGGEPSAHEGIERRSEQVLARAHREWLAHGEELDGGQLRIRQLVDLGGHPPEKGARGRHRPGQPPEPVAELEHATGAGTVEQLREQGPAAPALPVKSSAGRRVGRVPQLLLHDLSGRRFVEGLDLDLAQHVRRQQPGEGPGEGGAGAAAEDRCQSLVEKSVSQDLGRLLVEPMGVVDQHQVGRIEWPDLPHAVDHAVPARPRLAGHICEGLGDPAAPRPGHDHPPPRRRHPTGDRQGQAGGLGRRYGRSCGGASARHWSPSQAA
jgi:hypothetical protein